MAALWTDAQGTVLAGMNNLTRQLSDGTQLLLLPDSSFTSWHLLYAADHATRTQFATITPPTPTSVVDLCVDAADNVYVVYQSASGKVSVQAFVKGAGYSWTASAAIQVSTSIITASVPCLQWANTGGGTSGAGHLLLYMQDVNSRPTLMSLDSGVALAGSGTLLIGNVEIVLAAESTVHLSADGFGASQGLLCFIGYAVYSWHVDSTGALTTALIASPAAFTSTYGRLLSLGSGLWVLVAGGGVSNSHLSAAVYSLTGQVVAPVDCGTPSGGWTLPGLTFGWDAFVDPNQAGRLWVLSWSSSPVTTVMRVGISVTPSAVTWDTAAVVDASSFGNANTAGHQSGICCTHQPKVVTDYIGWTQNASAVQEVSGDTSQPTGSGNVPNLLTPTVGTYLDAAGGIALTWTAPAADGATQAGFCIRYKIQAAASYLYYNVATGLGQSTPVYNAGSSGAFTLPASVLANGQKYVVAASTLSSTRIASSFTPDRVVVTAKAPTLVVTAPTGSYTTNNHPVTTWAASLAPGLAQLTYQAKLFTAAQAGISDFDPDVSPSTWDSGVVTSTASTAGPVPVDLSDDTGLVAAVQLTQAGGQKSAWAISTFDLTASLPATPSVASVANGTVAAPNITVTVTNPAPSGGAPSVTSVDVYRRIFGATDGGIRVAAGLSPGTPFMDYTAADAQIYQYKAVAAAASGATSASGWSGGSRNSYADRYTPAY